MRVTEHVHSLLLHFEIEMPGGARIPCFVPAYVIDTERLTLVDTGVKSSADVIFRYIESLGRRPEDIDLVIHTHGHFDHIGDMRAKNTSGSVKVEGVLEEGVKIDLGGGAGIEVLHTPGHSPGSVSLFMPGEGALFCGDVLPEPGVLPIYEDVRQTLESLDKLRALRGAEILLSQLSDQIWRGENVAGHIDAGEAYLRRIDALVRRAGAEIGEGATVKDIGARVFSELGLPGAGLIPIVLTSIAAHLALKPALESTPG